MRGPGCFEGHPLVAVLDENLQLDEPDATQAVKKGTCTSVRLYRKCVGNSHLQILVPTKLPRPRRHVEYLIALKQESRACIKAGRNSCSREGEIGRSCHRSSTSRLSGHVAERSTGPVTWLPGGEKCSKFINNPSTAPVLINPHSSRPSAGLTVPPIGLVCIAHGHEQKHEFVLHQTTMLFD